MIFRAIFFVDNGPIVDTEPRHAVAFFTYRMASPMRGRVEANVVITGRPKGNDISLYCVRNIEKCCQHTSKINESFCLQKGSQSILPAQR